MNRGSRRGGDTVAPHSPVSIRLLGVVLLFGVLLAALAAGLRPDAFYAGDPGVKLIAAREALAHPGRPLEVDLPTIAGERVPHVSPFFAVHGTHAHAITSPLFPVLTAPLLGAFGLRGAYLLPALGFLVILGASAWAARQIDPARREVVVAVTIGLGSPLVFYGLELWEHSLSVAMGTAALALLLARRSLLAGVAFGVAVLLRPEAIWFGVAVLVASPLLPARVSARDWIRAGAGAMLALAPLEIYTVAHMRTSVPLHIGSNVGDLNEGWWTSRAPLLTLWFLGTTPAAFWRVAPVVVGACAALGMGARRHGRAFLWLVALADIALVVLTAPNDGGGQWGPRYLLFAYVPLGILAGDAVAALLARPQRGIAIGLACVVAAGAIWIQRDGYRQLRGTKATYGQIVDFVRTQVSPGGVLVTDLWWLDQVAAAATADRQVLYAGDAETARGIMRRLSDAAVPVVTVIRSASEPRAAGPWTENTCLVEERRDRLSTRALVAVTLRRQCP